MNACLSVLIFTLIGVHGVASLPLLDSAIASSRAVALPSKQALASIYGNIISTALLETQRPNPTPTPMSTSQVSLKLSAVAVSNNQINLSWASNSGNTTGFYVERALSAKGPWKRVLSFAATTTSCAHGGLSPSTTYFFRVMTHTSQYSNIVSATTLSNLPEGGPTKLVARSTGPTQINLSWTNNASDVTGFKIERCQGNDCSDFTEIQTLSTSDTAYQNTNLTPLTSYSYRVRAYNSNATSDYSNLATATTQRITTPPTPPAQVSATAVSPGRINLRWNPSTSSSGLDVAGYNVYQSGVHIVSTPKTSYAVIGLTANTMYCYTVSAFDKAGNRSDLTAEVCATTKSDPDP